MLTASEALDLTKSGLDKELGTISEKIVEEAEKGRRSLTYFSTKINLRNDVLEEVNRLGYIVSTTQYSGDIREPPSITYTICW